MGYNKPCCATLWIVSQKWNYIRCSACDWWDELCSCVCPECWVLTPAVTSLVQAALPQKVLCPGKIVCGLWERNRVRPQALCHWTGFKFFLEEGVMWLSGSLVVQLSSWVCCDSVGSGSTWRISTQNPGRVGKNKACGFSNRQKANWFQHPPGLGGPFQSEVQ